MDHIDGQTLLALTYEDFSLELGLQNGVFSINPNRKNKAFSFDTLFS